jgi:hypothetical protein
MINFVIARELAERLLLAEYDKKGLHEEMARSSLILLLAGEIAPVETAKGILVEAVEAAINDEAELSSSHAKAERVVDALLGRVFPEEVQG